MRPPSVRDYFKLRAPTFRFGVLAYGAGEGILVHSMVHTPGTTSCIGPSYEECMAGPGNTLRRIAEPFPYATHTTATCVLDSGFGIFII